MAISAADRQKLLRLTPEDLAALQPGDLALTKALMQIRQSMYDLQGAYPQNNILPYFYNFSLTVAQANALAANGTAQASIKISADSAFIATQIQGASTGAYLIFPRTDSSDRQLANNAVNSAAFTGTAERPMYLAKPLLLAANTTISFDLTDLSGAQNEVYLTLHGYKVYGRE